MSIKEEILQWRREKAERGRAVAQILSTHRRADAALEQHFWRKSRINKLIQATSGNVRLRNSMFEMFNRVDLYRRMRIHHGTVGNVRQILKNIRLLRLNNGLPPVFFDYEREFWFDPSTGFIPEDDLFAALKTMNFDRITLLMRSQTAYRITQDLESGRRHRGLWSWCVDHDYETSHPDEAIPHMFWFSHASDLMEFRLLYPDYPQVSNG